MYRNWHRTEMCIDMQRDEHRYCDGFVQPVWIVVLPAEQSAVVSVRTAVNVCPSVEKNTSRVLKP